MFIFRKDINNVGDWWSPPFKYFKFNSSDNCDLMDPNLSKIKSNVIILGGGGLGKDFFYQYINNIKKFFTRSKLITWGVGFTLYENKNKKTLLDPGKIQHKTIHKNIFEGFDLIGCRDFGLNFKNYTWLPCASCMHNDFEKFHSKTPTKKIGIYHHYRFPLKSDLVKDEDIMDNSGNDINIKLKFLSNYEYIITNTYHGVYWSQLLNRKSICVPFKSSVLNFKYKPLFALQNISDKDFEEVKNYPNYLDECRNVNKKFYQDVLNNFF